jgi:hypothetical protein
MTRDGKAYYYHDALDSVVALADESGTKVNTHASPEPPPPKRPGSPTPTSTPTVTPSTASTPTGCGTGANSPERSSKMDPIWIVGLFVGVVIGGLTVVLMGRRR